MRVSHGSDFKSGLLAGKVRKKLERFGLESKESLRKVERMVRKMDFFEVYNGYGGGPLHPTTVVNQCALRDGHHRTSRFA